MSALKVELVAADRRVWTGSATFVRVRTVNGDLGILPGHAPVLGALVAGEILIDAGEQGRHVATIDDGFLSVDSDTVTICANSVTNTDLTLATV